MAKTDISVQELVTKIRRQELMLPEMQRRYVWPATRVRDLLDSLYRGYPSGTILVWETDEEIEAISLAVHGTAEPTTTSRLLLLDGQQRLTSLAAVLSGEPVCVRSRRRPIDILFNLDHPDGPPVEMMEVEEDFTTDMSDVEDEESEERDLQEEMKKRTFVVASRSLQNNQIWVPVSDIFKKSDKDILRNIGISIEDERWDKYSDRLSNVRKIRDYMYVMQKLEKNMSYEEVTEIFVRVNSLGIKLRGSDLAMAQITSRWPGFMKLIEDLAREFVDDTDYIIDTGLPVRLLTIFATHQSRFKTISRVPLATMKESWSKAKEGLCYAVNFLRSNGDIGSLQYLSSPFLIIPIAVYYILQGGNITPADSKKLLRWFYYAHMRAHYSMGSSESILDADLSILFKGKNLDELLAQLHLHVKKFDVDVSDLFGRGIRSPFFSMLYFVLRKNGAKDWFDDLKLSDQHVGKAHSIQFHHIFPKSLLKDTYDKKEINEIANLAFVGGKTNRRITNREPMDYLENEVVQKRGEEALTLQLVSLDKTLWGIPTYREFLTSRREAIAETLNVFMKKFE